MEVGEVKTSAIIDAIFQSGEYSLIHPFLTLSCEGFTEN